MKESKYIVFVNEDNYEQKFPIYFKLDNFESEYKGKKYSFEQFSYRILTRSEALILISKY